MFKELITKEKPINNETKNSIIVNNYYISYFTKTLRSESFNKINDLIFH